MIAKRNEEINSKLSSSLLSAEKSVKPSKMKKGEADERKTTAYIKGIKEKVSLISQIQRNNERIEKLKK